VAWLWVGGGQTVDRGLGRESFPELGAELGGTGAGARLRLCIHPIDFMEIFGVFVALFHT
jgi:hypothetical protein